MNLNKQKLVIFNPKHSLRFDNLNNLAVLAIIISSVIWGATPAIMKYTLLTVPVFSLGFIRFFGASLILLPFVLRKINIKDITPLVVGAALLGITVHISFFFLGLKLTTALNAGIISAFYPILTLIFAHILLSEKIKGNILVGAVLGIAGLGIIIGKDILTSGFTLSPLGDFLIISSAIVGVLYAIFSKKILEKHSPILVSFYLFAIGGLAFFPFAFWEWQTSSIWITNLSINASLGILFGILFASLIAHSFWQWGLSKMDVTKVGFFHYLEPVVATITAVIILSERITLPFILGSICIILGLVLAEIHRHHRLPAHK